MRQPSKEALINKLELILQGTISREAVADWASKFVMQDEPNITDEIVWELLQVVSGVDLKNSPDEYLHVEQDIKNWIERYSSISPTKKDVNH